MRLIDRSSLVVMFSSDAERPTMAATSASCAVNDGGVSEAMAFGSVLVGRVRSRLY